MFGKSMKQILTNKYWVISIAIFCSMLWGSAFPVLKVSYKELGLAENDFSAKIVFAGMRFFLASLLLLLIMVLSSKKSLFVKKVFLFELFILGILSTSLQYIFFYNGLAHTSGMKASILVSSGTFFVVILAHFFYTNDKLDWKKTIGLLTGFGGIVAVNWGKSFTLDFNMMGEGFLILSGLVNAISTILAKRLSQHIHPISLTGWQMLIGSLLLLGIGTPQLRAHAMTFTPLAWGLLFYSAVLSATAFSLWFALLKYNKAGEISVYKFVIPVTGTILSALVIPGEKLTYLMIEALALVAIGIIAVNYKPTSKKDKSKLKQGKRDSYEHEG